MSAVPRPSRRRAARPAEDQQRRNDPRNDPRVGRTPPRVAGGRPSTTTRPGPRRGRPLGLPGVRLRGGLAAILVVLALLAGRLVQLQGLQPEAYAGQAVAQRTQTLPLPAGRGQVLDRSGSPLAESVAMRSVVADPMQIGQAECKPGHTRPCTPGEIAAALAAVLHVDPASLVGKLTGDRQFVYLARKLEVAVGDAVSALRLPGIVVQDETERVHPGHSVAANLIGFTDGEGKGVEGVERSWEQVLAGVPGKIVAEYDHQMRVIPTGQGHLLEPVPGRSVQLTIDRDLQWYAQQQLAAEVAATGAVNGTAITMDVRTGQVLAMATAPTFDPDDRRNTKPEWLRNPAVQDTYEPGSVNKVITAAAALQAGVVTPDTVIDVPPTYKVAGHVLHDAEDHGEEHLTFTGVLAKSSNIGTVKVAQLLGKERLYAMLRTFGFGSLTGVGLPAEQPGVVPEPQNWSGTSISTIPIGQGISVNALQMASVYATVANGGVRVAPTVVAGTVDGSGRLTPTAAPAARRVISPQIAAQLRTMLEAVISDKGTAPLAAIPGYRVAGKTGTAQRVVNGRYQAGNYTSSFVGFAPADAPRLVTAVVLQGTGKHGYFGGAVAAPVFESIMSFALRSLSIPPTGTVPPVLRLSAG